MGTMVNMRQRATSCISSGSAQFDALKQISGTEANINLGIQGSDSGYCDPYVCTTKQIRFNVHVSNKIHVDVLF